VHEEGRKRAGRGQEEGRKRAGREQEGGTSATAFVISIFSFFVPQKVKMP
jgi:hypothetical protein